MPARVRVARSSVRSLRLLLLLALLSAACSGGTPSGEDAPQPTEVVPNEGCGAAPLAVKITGSQFLAQAKQKAGGGAATLDTRHRAWLDEVELQDVTWVSATELTATVPPGLPVGAHRLTVENALGERGTLDGAFTVLSESCFSAAVATDRTTVSEGQEFQLTLTATNAGSSDITDLALAPPSLSSSDGAEATLEPGSAPSAPATLAAGASQSFTWTFQATKAGHLSATVGATGKEALSGVALTATGTAQVNVQTPPRLSAALSIPQFVPVSSATESKDFTVTMTITNSGGADAVDVTPTALSSTLGDGYVTATPKAGPTPASAAVPAGQAVSFTWTYTAGTSIGSLQLSGAAAGKDANSGAAATARAVPSNLAHAGNAAIIVTIENPPAQAFTGRPFDVTVSFRNPGPGPVTSFRVFSAPSGVVSGPSGTQPTLGPGQQVHLTYTVTPPAGEGLQITFTGLGYDGTPAQVIEASATATILVSSPP